MEVISIERLKFRVKVQIEKEFDIDVVKTGKQGKEPGTEEVLIMLNPEILDAIQHTSQQLDNVLEMYQGKKTA